VQGFLDAKVMAKVLRLSLAERGLALTHAECLELVARQFGLPNWNVLAARIEQANQSKQELDLPEGWRVATQTVRRFYRLGLDPTMPGELLIESRFGRESGVELEGQFGALMQSLSAESFIGRRVRFSGDLCSEDADAASLWLRVDAAPGQVLRFDNMLDRQLGGLLKGVTKWTRWQVVLDIPEQAMSLHFGVLLQRHGRVWARHLSLDIVDETVPLTGWGTWLPEPLHLGFAGK